MVIATGIISIEAAKLCLPVLARARFLLNLGVYATPWLLYTARLIRYPHQSLREQTDHLRGPGFFALVAASSVLGSQLLLLAHSVRGGVVLWVITVVLWLLLTYTMFASFTIKENKPTLDRGINGGWLLAWLGAYVGATNSVVRSVRIRLV